MFEDYLNAAMGQASYELRPYLLDNNYPVFPFQYENDAPPQYYTGEVMELGVRANGITLESCRKTLKHVIEVHILKMISVGVRPPRIRGFDLSY